MTTLKLARITEQENGFDLHFSDNEGWESKQLLRLEFIVKDIPLFTSIIKEAWHGRFSQRYRIAERGRWNKEYGVEWLKMAGKGELRHDQLAKEAAWKEFEVFLDDSSLVAKTDLLVEERLKKHPDLNDPVNDTERIARLKKLYYEGWTYAAVVT